MDEPQERPRTAAEIQQEIDFMRAMYARRRSQNAARHEALVGWCLCAVAVAVLVIVAWGVIFYLGQP